MTSSSKTDVEAAQSISADCVSAHPARRWHRLLLHCWIGFIVLPLIVTPATARADLDSGWWVIVGNGPEPALERRSIRSAVMAAASHCGYKPFNDFSAKFSGFAPGYETFVIGAYSSKREASVHLQAIKPCIHSAYIKFARYAGE